MATESTRHVTQCFAHAVPDDAGDEPGDFLTNLTLDGVKEGAYMLCKHSDDLLGHHARQVFREKAASRRGANSIYYYLKDLIKQFGQQHHHHHNTLKKKNGGGSPSEMLVLTPHEFRKLVASDPAFVCAIPTDQVDALFHRIEQEPQKNVSLRDFVEFCLLDQHQLRLLLFKFRKGLKRLQLTDNEISDTFKRLTNTGSNELSPDLFHSALTRELDVVLTTGEIAFMMHLLDYDKDGLVKLPDLETFIKDDRVSDELVHPLVENAITDLKIATNESDEITFKRDGYSQLSTKTLDDNWSVNLWFKKVPREEGRPAITNIKYAVSSRDTELVSAGYTCLQQDLNRSGAFGKHKYIWMSYVNAAQPNKSEVIAMALTDGDLDDKHDARLWIAPHRGFKLVPGNLIEKSQTKGIFLWLRRQRVIATSDLVEPHVDLQFDLTSPVSSPKTKSKLKSHVDGLEAQVRTILRRNCPTDQDGALNFGRLFDEFDTKKTRALGRQDMLVGIESFGIKMGKKDFPHAWERINPFGMKKIDVDIFVAFLELTDSDIDEVVTTVQRSMTTRSTVNVPNYRLIFQSYNSLNDGKLSRSDFQRLLATNQINFTNTELGKIMQRFDVNKDGVVDYADFLRYVTGVCDVSTRTAMRVAEAAEEIRCWAVEKQNKKLVKDGNIDSTTAWRLLQHKSGHIEKSSIDHLLRQRKIRLDAMKLTLLTVLMAPASNGKVTQAAFHAFVNHMPRKIATMLYDLRKLFGSMPAENTGDSVFDRLNIEGNGKLELVKFLREVNACAKEKGENVFDLKDFVYVVQWTGSDCGGDGAILIDRFLAGVRNTPERRNMKNEFVTHYDSPKFIEGVQLLRDEIKRCAKTPDGKYNYFVPFRQFDKDNSGQIVLSEFENAVRELGVDKYLSDQEVRGLMRRFHLNQAGAIDYDEFVRFNLAESSSSSGRKLVPSAASEETVQEIIRNILINERLTVITAVTFCGSMKRMFGIIDKGTTGLISAQRFVQTLTEMSISIPNGDMKVLLKVFAGRYEDDTEGVQYLLFCDTLLRVCHEDRQHLSSGIPTNEMMDLLLSLFHECSDAQHNAIESGRKEFNFYNAFGVDKDSKQQKFLNLTTDDFKEIIWASGVRHPYLQEELEVIMRCFEATENVDFNVTLFCYFLNIGPRALYEANYGALDVCITRLQDEFRSYLSTGKDSEERLRKIFEEHDKDKSGYISYDEFRDVLNLAGLRHFLTPEDQQLLIKFIDLNGDGVIAYREFLEFIKRADTRPKEVTISSPPSPAPSPAQSSAPLASPAKSAALPSPAKSPVARSPAKGKYSPTAKAAPPNDPPKKETHLLVLSYICKLNRKLRPAFPFDKYFKKYKLKQAEPCVKSRVFEKILDKFLDRLMEYSIAYNMHDMDIKLVASSYSSKAGDTTNYERFLEDLTKVASSIAANVDSSDSSDDENDDLSCSSDDEQQARHSAKSINAMIRGSIQRAYKSKPELEKLQSKAKELSQEMEKKGSQGKISEHKLYKVLTKLTIRMRTDEVDVLLTFLANEQHGRHVYDVQKLLQIIQTQLCEILGTSKSPGKNDSKPTCAEANKAGSEATKQGAKQALSAVLRNKISQCFVTSAQRNVSGQKLLEKCDPSKTGFATVLEFQTILRLMGCILTDTELSEIKSALGDDKGSQIKYTSFVKQLTPQADSSPKVQQMTAPSSPPRLSRQSSGMAPPSSVPDRAPSPIKLRSQQLLPSSSFSSLPSHQVMLSHEEAKRIDSFLRPFFLDQLDSRHIASYQLIQAFEAYDIKGTGFIALDAFFAVMRKLDIPIAQDMMSTVLTRFANLSSEKFDYVDFCQAFSISYKPGAFMHVPTSGRGAEDGQYSARTENDVSGIRKEYQAGKVDIMTISEDTFKPPKMIHEDTAHKDRKMRSSYSFPTMDSEASQTSAVEKRLAHVVSAPAGLGWTCPVCFHTQSKSTSSCEICAAQNPATVAYETLQQCAACAFRNSVTATQCELCRLPLNGKTVERPSGSSSMESPKKFQLKLPSNSAFDDGWRT